MSRVQKSLFQQSQETEKPLLTRTARPHVCGKELIHWLYINSHFPEVMKNVKASDIPFETNPDGTHKNFINGEYVLRNPFKKDMTRPFDPTDIFGTNRDRFETICPLIAQDATRDTLTKFLFMIKYELRHFPTDHGQPLDTVVFSSHSYQVENHVKSIQVNIVYKFGSHSSKDALCIVICADEMVTSYPFASVKNEDEHLQVLNQLAWFLYDFPRAIVSIPQKREPYVIENLSAWRYYAYTLAMGEKIPMIFVKPLNYEKTFEMEIASDLFLQPNHQFTSELKKTLEKSRKENMIFCLQWFESLLMIAKTIFPKEITAELPFYSSFEVKASCLMRTKTGNQTGFNHNAPLRVSSVDTSKLDDQDDSCFLWAFEAAVKNQNGRYSISTALNHNMQGTHAEIVDLATKSVFNGRKAAFYKIHGKNITPYSECLYHFSDGAPCEMCFISLKELERTRKCRDGNYQRNGFCFSQNVYDQIVLQTEGSDKPEELDFCVELCEAFRDFKKNLQLITKNNQIVIILVATTTVDWRIGGQNSRKALGSHLSRGGIRNVRKLE